MPSWFGGGCLGWILALVVWGIIIVVFPFVLAGWVIIICGALAMIGGNGGA